MTTLTWDDPGTRLYEQGLDRGVLYLEDGSGVPWNGLTAVEEDHGDSKTDPQFFDGIKFIDSPMTGDFAASVKAYTFPDELMEYEGTGEVAEGLFVGNQTSKTFSMSYRTLVGSDTEGDRAGYRIHILYNLTAIPQEINHQTDESNVNVVDFGWDVTSKYENPPDYAPIFKPTSHVIIDSRYIHVTILELVETMLYGSANNDAHLPTLEELGDLIAEFWFVVTDNGDGTWTAEASDELEMIEMLDETTFQITNANAVYLNEDKYRISSGVAETPEFGDFPDRNVLLFPGETGNAVATPDRPSIEVATKATWMALVNVDEYLADDQNRAFMSKYHGGTDQREYTFQLTNTDQLWIQIYDDGGFTPVINIVRGFTGFTGWVWIAVTFDGDNGSDQHQVRAWTSPPLETPTWTQLGSTHTVSGTMSIFNGDADLIIGATGTESPNRPWLGGIARVIVTNDIDTGGQPGSNKVVDWDAFEHSKAARIFVPYVDPHGNVWTLQKNNSAFRFVLDEVYEEV